MKKIVKLDNEESIDINNLSHKSLSEKLIKKVLKESCILKKNNKENSFTVITNDETTFENLIKTLCGLSKKKGIDIESLLDNNKYIYRRKSYSKKTTNLNLSLIKIDSNIQKDNSCYFLKFFNSEQSSFIVFIYDLNFNESNKDL